VVEGIIHSCLCSTWKPTSHVMATKVLQIASWVPMHSLSWVQRKRCNPYNLWDVCTCIKGYLQLKDVVISVAIKMLWGKMGKII
jgi:hypothetical protein